MCIRDSLVTNTQPTTTNPHHKRQETNCCRREQQNTKEQKKLHNTTNQPHKNAVQRFAVWCSRPLYSSHTTPQPTNKQQSKRSHCLLKPAGLHQGDNAPDTQQCTNEPHNYFRPLTFHTMFCVFIVWCVSTRLKTLLAAPPTGTQPTTKETKPIKTMPSVYPQLWAK